MSEENIEIVRRVYEAAARRDPATVLALYDAEVELDVTHGPARKLWGSETVYRGHEGLRSFFREWHEVWEDLEEDVEELIETGEHVISVVTSRARGRASGAEVEMTSAVVWTLREGKIARVVFFETRDKALKAAGLSG